MALELHVALLDVDGSTVLVQVQDRHGLSMATATRQCLTEGSAFMECVESCTEEDRRE